MTTLKDLKRLLKKAGMKSSGSKRALTRRAKKAHLMRGGNEEADRAAAAKITAEAAKSAPAAARLAADESAAERIRDAADYEGRRASMRERGILPPASEEQRERYLASVPYGSRPGGFRKTKKSAPKKTVTKKRPVRHLSASAYRW
jgi:hypothetical protein